VLSGSASELERELPFSVFVDALDEYVQGLEPSRLDALDDDTRAELAHVLPALTTLGAGDGAVLQQERYRAHRAVCRLLEELAQTKPLVLLLDDLHWADSGSLELLGSLLRRPPSAAVLTAITLRPRQLPDRLAVALERARRAGTVTRLELGVLGPDEARQLLGTDVSGGLYEESGGNPFYLEQLARWSHRADNDVPAASAVSLAGVQVPRAVAAALAEELALLPAGTRRVLEGAAVAGDPFEPELAAAADGVHEPAAVDALDELLRRDLVRPTDVPRRFRFRHPLVRGAVYGAAPGGWRLAAHERCADYLALRGASTAVRAHHVDQAGRFGDPAAVAVLREAAEGAARRDPATAARLFAGALRLLTSAGPPSARVELLEALAESHAAAGQFNEAYVAMLQSLELLPADAVAPRVRLTAACAGLEHLLGRQREAHTRLMTALEGLSDTTSAEAVVLMIELAGDGLYRLDYGSMGEWARRALTTARPLGDRRLTASAAGLLAFAGVLSGAVADAEVARAEAAAIVDTMPDEQLAQCLDRAVNALAAAELYLERYEDAAGHAERGLAVARRTGQGALLPILFSAEMIRRMRGRLAEAVDVLDASVEAARLSGHAVGLAWSLLSRSRAATAMGDVETALATAEESFDAVRAWMESYPKACAGFGLAAALHDAGESGRAIEVLMSTAGGEELALSPPPGGPRASSS
jgi:tetratricopeptide (TPR) repeat protein